VNPRYLNDDWTLDLETLGFEPLAMEVAKKALYCQPPFSQCIAGRWGSGKTSVMRYAMTVLGGDLPSAQLPSLVSHEPSTLRDASEARATLVDGLHQKGEREIYLQDQGFVSARASRIEKESFGVVFTTWFSPWRFQHEPNPMVPLLHLLRDQFTAWAKTKKWARDGSKMALKVGIESLGKLADAASKLSFGMSPGLGGMAKLARESGQRFSTEDYAVLTDAERFNLKFEEAIRTILGVTQKKSRSPKEQNRPAHRLVIFIDDLDRVEGAAVVRLLEAIKLYLSTEYCVFVFGLDVTAVESAIVGHWKDRPPSLAGEYLDKLFQSYVHMPVSSNYPAFVAQEIKRWGLKSKRDTPLSASELETLSGRHASDIADTLIPNPRKVKNYLNSLQLALRTTSYEVRREDLVRFSLVHRLRSSAPGTFALLTEDAEAWAHFRAFSSKAVARDGLENDKSPHITGVFVHDFGHLLSGLGDSKLANFGGPELRVRIDRVGAGIRFLKHWTIHWYSTDQEKQEKLRVAFFAMAGRSDPKETPTDA